jgi:hypothetical protein
MPWPKSAPYPTLSDIRDKIDVLLPYNDFVTDPSVYRNRRKLGADKLLILAPDGRKFLVTVEEIEG